LNITIIPKKYRMIKIRESMPTPTKRNDGFNNILKVAIVHRNIPKMAVRIWPGVTSPRRGPGP
jgi:hypothetical protein